MVKIAVLGATGAVGKHVVMMALQQGHEVVAVARSPHKIELADSVAGLTKVKADMLDASSVALAIEDVDVVVSCIGVTQGSKTKVMVVEATVRAVVEAMADGKHGSRFVVLSSVGVGDSRTLLMRYAYGIMFSLVIKFVLHKEFKDLAAAENVLHSSSAASNVDYVCVRPSALDDKSARGKWRETTDVRRGKVSMHICRKDVAAAMLREAVDPKYHRADVCIGN